MVPFFRRSSRLSRLTVLAAGLGLATVACSADAPPPLVPWPTSVTTSTSQTFPVTAETRIVYDVRSVSRTIEHSLEPLAHVLAGEIELVTGIRPAVEAINAAERQLAGNIVLQFAPLSGTFAETEAEEDQAYTLAVTRSHILVRSQYYKGVAYGTATVLQALTLDGDRAEVPGLQVFDQPTAAYRAVMIDVARQVHSPEVIEDVIRMARLYKLRYLQLHLTDNQNFTFPFAPVTDSISDNFAYSRKQLSDLVAYADARGVTLIPEVDLPGHSARLKASNYLLSATTDAELAAPANYPRIHALIDDVLDVFRSSPYFHIGGDESGAGSALIPFLASLNRHLRSKTDGPKRRLVMWEGFRGAPTRELPATGDDHVVVMAWESVYNPPWDLLTAGYRVINASWKPTYIVGLGTPIRPRNTWGRRFDPEDLYRWDKNTFMHWQPTLPVYEDEGPNDPDRSDSEWNAGWIERDSQIFGGQLVVWEQKETSVINSLTVRLPIVAERLWNPRASESYQAFAQRAQRVIERTMTVVQPVAVLPVESADPPPVSMIYQPYSGASMTYTLRNRTRVQGDIRYNEGGFSDDLTMVEFPDTPPITSADRVYIRPVEKSGGFSVRAQLFRADGTPVEGTTWKFFNNWPDRVRVTGYDIDRKSDSVVADLAALPASRVLSRYVLPMLRGNIRGLDIRGEMIEAVLTPPGSGSYEISVETRDGHATLYLDQNRDGLWDADEALILNTPGTGATQRATIELRADQPLRIRVDHNTGQPRPLLLVQLEGPGTNGLQEISRYLTLPGTGSAQQDR